MNENPLQNEPGFENVIDKRHLSYNTIIEHENVNISIIRMIKNIPKGFENFKPILEKVFIMVGPIFALRQMFLLCTS